MAVSALEQKIMAVISGQGPLSLAAYMTMALQDPDHGYYRTANPVGRDGDFITAPEISQLFGEMIGVWCVERWRQLGQPEAFALAEFGPGRGTMMRDIVRATRHVNGFHAAARLHLCESNAVLREQQQALLAAHAPVFITHAGDLPALPAIIVANEFFDALPVRQFERSFTGWQERMVTVADGGLAFTLRPLSAAELPLIPVHMRDRPPGTVYELSADSATTMRDLARHLARQSGAALIIDYGYAQPAGFATAQAISRHARAEFLDRPGEIDLTAHVDFSLLAAAARAGGCIAAPVVGQGVFLQNLGIEVRAAMLARRVDAAQAEDITTAVGRLTADDQMGSLFKVLVIEPQSPYESRHSGA